VSRGRVGAAALALTGALHATIVPQYETTSVLLGAGAVVAVLVAFGTAWTIWQEPRPGAWAVAALVGVALVAALAAGHQGNPGDAAGPGLRDGAAALAATVVVVLAADGLRSWAADRRRRRARHAGCGRSQARHRDHGAPNGSEAGGRDRRGAVDGAPRT